jgi:RHS repeat-associated protein
VQGTATFENNTLHVMDDQSRIALVRVGNPFPDDTTPAVKYQLGDHLGSSNVVVGVDGEWVNREEYTPYGETSFGSFARKRYRYTGMERDEESGLNYHAARYYASWLARWLNSDPIGIEGGINLYAYSRLNPIHSNDKTGTAPEGCEAEGSLDAGICVPTEARTADDRTGHWVTERELREGKREFVDTLIIKPLMLVPYLGEYIMLIEGSTYVTEAITGKGSGGHLSSILSGTGDLDAGVTLSADERVSAGLNAVLNLAPLIKGMAGAKAATETSGAMADGVNVPLTKTISPGSTARLTKAIENRMSALKVPIGTIKEPVKVGNKTIIRGNQRSRGFVPDQNNVGLNDPAGISIDAGILENAPNWPEWNKAKLNTRVDAVIAHEWAEFTGLSHIDAVKFGAETVLKISEAARELLRSMPLSPWK